MLAHCVSGAVDAVDNGARSPDALAHAGLLAESVALDMRASWQPTAANYLGRVPKALIQEAVTEAVSSEAAERIAGLKKADMASAAEALLRDSGWLPKQLRPRSVARDERDAASSRVTRSKSERPPSGGLSFLRFVPCLSG